MNNSYLLNLILLFISVLLYFDKRGQAFKDWKALLPAVVITGILSVVTKMVLARYKLVHYDQTTLSGISYFDIPLEAALLCFTVPLAGVVIYAYLNGRYPNNDFEKYSLALSNVFLGLSIAIIFFAYTMAYAVITFSLFLLLILYIEYINKYRFMYKFYRAYGVLLVLYAFSQLLFDSQHVAYHIEHTLKFNLVGVPFENYFLLGVHFLSAVYLFEFFKRPDHGLA